MIEALTSIIEIAEEALSRSHNKVEVIVALDKIKTIAEELKQQQENKDK